MEFHKPVLLKETLEYLNPQPGQTVVDGTLGGAGHSLAIAGRIAPNGILIGIDLDPESLAEAKLKFKNAKLQTKTIFVHDNYKNIDAVLSELGIDKVDGILIDIGISSYDLERSFRGFSFQKEEPLDMRFNPEAYPGNKKHEDFNAKYIINRYQEKELERVFREHGEEKFSRKIARAIVAARQQREILTTTDLFEIIKKALPANIRFKAGDSARRIFQALRIEVNKELDNLQQFLPKAFDRLKSNGRLVVISFHSLEDRIVKQFFNDKAKGCICPPEFPECRCGRNPQAKILTKKPITASEAEQQENSRSIPAKLRAIQKI